MNTINFKKKEGPVTIEVTSGYATLGSFVLALRKKDDYNYVEFGINPKRIDDNIEDIHLIPIDIDKLEDYKVLILGKYKPAPTKSQIKVTYTFVQNNEVIFEETLKEKTDEVFVRFKNKYEFKKI